jgi:hypothetical protein
VRASRFQADIEAIVRAAAVAFRDNDIENTLDAAVRLWWRTGLRGRRFIRLVQQARRITEERVSLGLVKRGKPGQREGHAILHGGVERLARMGSGVPADNLR